MLELKPMIHKFRMKDNYYCLDVNSGIIHVIDELIDRVLDIYDGHQSRCGTCCVRC